MPAISPRLSARTHAILFAAVVACVLALALAPYRGNVTALFHMDRSLASLDTLPPRFVVLDGPGYDGMQYYQIARNIPAMLAPSRWTELTANEPPGLYAYQRFLLPLTAFVLAGGQGGLLPYSFLLINLAALILVFAVVLRTTGKPLYAFALALCPAAMVALHFSLAEPLTLLLLTLFLRRYTKQERLSWIDIVLLSLIVLSREVNILFIGGTLLYSLGRRRWRDALLLCIPIAVFLALQTWILLIFGQMPFFLSAAKRDVPFVAPVRLLIGGRYNQYTLSAIALLLLFVVPTVCLVIRDVWRERSNVDCRISHVSLPFLHVMLLGFLFVMLAMPDFIWGSITSIGRVITPVYPLFTTYALLHDRPIDRLLAGVVLLLGLATALGLALSLHPYTLT